MSSKKENIKSLSERRNNIIRFISVDIFGFMYFGKFLFSRVAVIFPSALNIYFGGIKYVKER